MIGLRWRDERMFVGHNGDSIARTVVNMENDSDECTSQRCDVLMC